MTQGKQEGPGTHTPENLASGSMDTQPHDTTTVIQNAMGLLFPLRNFSFLAIPGGAQVTSPLSPAPGQQDRELGSP